MAEKEPTRKLGAGVLMAALRQGGKEIGTALKAFPESISIEEPGQMLNPTQGEIAEVNRTGSLWCRVQASKERAEATKAAPEKDRDRE